MSAVHAGESKIISDFVSYRFHLIRAGYNGHECLLRAICEAADTPLGMDNGVLGDILHIVLT